MAQPLSRYKALPSASSIERLRDDETELEDLSTLAAVKSRGLKVRKIRPQIKWSSGLRIVATMMVSFIILLAVMVYLSFLWFGNKSNNSRLYWSRIVLSDWVTTSVVISALIIRVVTTTHTTLITSVLALTTMRTGVILNKIPRISSTRYSNSGSLDLLYLLFGSARYCLSRSIFFLALLSGALTILLQFTSTLLVSDLGNNLVVSPAKNSSNAVLPPRSYDPESLDHFYTDAFISSEPSYPIFAEFSRPEERSTDSRIDDTGPIIRALLPVPAEANRSRIRSFEGNASIYDARWICSQPKFTNINLAAGWTNIGWTNMRMFVTGYVEPSTIVPPMVTMNHSVSFNCSFFPTVMVSGTWTLVTCPLRNSDGAREFGLMSGIDTAYNATKVHTALNQMMEVKVGEHTLGRFGWFPFDPDKSMENGYLNPGDSVGHSYLLINVTNITDPMYNANDKNANDGIMRWEFAYNDSTAWNSNGIGPWTRLESAQAGLRELVYDPPNSRYLTAVRNWSIAIDVSFCSSAVAYVKGVHLKARRKTAQDEPISMSHGILQIGATGYRNDTEERGIMQLDEAGIDEQLEAESAEIVGKNYSGPINPVSTIFNDGSSYRCLPRTDRAWCPMAVNQHVDLRPVHESRASLFQRIIQDTGSPALAMQAMQHTIITDRYYKYMDLFSNQSTQTMTFWEQAIQPDRTRGFMVVMIGLLLHMALTGFTFFTLWGSDGWWETINSIDQSWQSYAQVLTLRAEVDGILDQQDSTLATDDQVEKTLKQQGVANQVFVLAEDDDGQIRFRKRREGLKKA